MRSLRSRFSFLAIIAIVVNALLSGIAYADQYPSGVIRVIVPFAAGGPVDAIARRLAISLGGVLGGHVMVDNRPGASGNIGAEAVARSPADGYTLLFAPSTLVVNPLVMKEKPHFDLNKDLTPLALIASGPLLFIVNPDAKANTVREFVTRAQEQPQRFNFGTGGYGAAGHISAEYFKLKAGLTAPVILYKGTGPAMIDLLSGQISGMMEPLLSSMPQVKAGKLKALAITGARRSPLAPEVPTFLEAGYKDMEFLTWYGLWAPANLPAPVSEKIDAALKATLSSAEFRTWLNERGLETSNEMGNGFRSFIEAEVGRYTRIMKETNITAQ